MKSAGCRIDAAILSGIKSAEPEVSGRRKVGVEVRADVEERAGVEVRGKGRGGDEVRRRSIAAVAAQTAVVPGVGVVVCDKLENFFKMQ